SRVYIMTLGVLAPYRRLRIGTLLLDSILRRCALDPSLEYVCLHVQTTNREALRFYRSCGFKVESRVDGYYLLNKGVEPPDAFFLKFALRGDAVGQAVEGDVAVAAEAEVGPGDGDDQEEVFDDVGDVQAEGLHDTRDVLIHDGDDTAEGWVDQDDLADMLEKAASGCRDV
ncbi:hypothetical protein HK101_005970, partial [Irineochytrium annulatum]